MGRFAFGRSLSLTILGIAGCILLGGCGGGNSTQVVTNEVPAVVNLAPRPNASLEVGKFLNFTAAAQNSAGNAIRETFSYQSSAPNIVTVSIIVQASPVSAAGDTYTTDKQGNRILTSTTRQWALSVPAISLWNAGVRYTFRSGGHSQQLGLNMNNVFDRIFLKTSRAPGDRRAIYVTYSIGFGSLRN